MAEKRSHDEDFSIDKALKLHCENLNTVIKEVDSKITRLNEELQGLTEKKKKYTYQISISADLLRAIASTSSSPPSSPSSPPTTPTMPTKPVVTPSEPNADFSLSFDEVNAIYEKMFKIEMEYRHNRHDGDSLKLSRIHRINMFSDWRNLTQKQTDDYYNWKRNPPKYLLPKYNSSKLSAIMELAAAAEDEI